MCKICVKTETFMEENSWVVKRKSEQGIIRIVYLDWARVGKLGRHEVGRSLEGV